MKYLALVISLFILSGCNLTETKVTDVSSQESKNGGFIVGSKYSLKEDFFVRGWIYSSSKEEQKKSSPDDYLFIGLTPPEGKEVGSVPSSFKVWKMNPEKYPLIYGVIQKSTKIKIINVSEVQSFEDHLVQVVAIILDGEFKDYIVDIARISIRSKDQLFVKPDSSKIMLIEQGGEADPIIHGPFFNEPHKL